VDSPVGFWSGESTDKRIEAAIALKSHPPSQLTPPGLTNAPAAPAKPPQAPRHHQEEPKALPIT
jgi:hypothetical protein